MSFEDLPDDLRQRPLTDPVLQADVIDLVLSPEVRRGGGVALVTCDERDRAVHCVALTDVPDSADPSAFRDLLHLLLPPVAAEGGSVLLGRGRRRSLAPTERDRVWHQCALDTCRRVGVRMLGFYVATAEGVAAMPEPLEWTARLG